MIRFAVHCKACASVITEDCPVRDGCAYDDPAKYLRTMAEPQRSQFAAFAVEHLAHGALPAIVDIGPISAAVAAVN